MTDLRTLQGIKVLVSAARGAALTEIARITGNWGALPNDSNLVVLDKFADYAITQNPGFRSIIPGPSNNTRATLSVLKAAATTDKTSLYNGSLWTWTPGDFTGKADDLTVVKADGAALVSGAWTRQYTTWSPRWTGAVEDGVTNDRNPIQQALDAIVASGRSGVLRLTDGATYKLNSGITIDTAYVSIEGNATLDFSGLSSGAAVTVVCSVRPSAPFNGSDGFKAAMRGNIVLRGPGRTSNSIGIDCNSPNAFTASQMLFEGITIGLFGTGVQFKNRGYNNTFVKCDINQCAIGVNWPAGGEDNNEANRFFGCVIYNGDTAIRNYTAASKIDLFGCSIDYNAIDYDVQYGRVEATSCHHESIRWSDRPIRCDGNGALIEIRGGTIVNQNSSWAANYLIDTGTDGVVRMRDVFANNLALTPLSGKPRTWATGTGRFELTGFESFNFGNFPLRLSTATTCLADPGFERPLGEDMIWRTADSASLPITTRYGVQGTDNLSLSRVTSGQDSGTGCLAAYKSSAANTNAAFNLICMPVRAGDKVLAGFKVRTDPARPGTVQSLMVQQAWAKIDGYDANRIPVVVRVNEIGTAPVTPTTTGYQSVEQAFALLQITAPPWATHFIMSINMFASAQTTALFDGLWADRC